MCGRLRPLIRKLKGQLHLLHPGQVAGLASHGVAIGIEIQLQRLPAELQRLAKAGADPDDPFAAWAIIIIALPVSKTGSATPAHRILGQFP
jgi:hypothetical protein